MSRFDAAIAGWNQDYPDPYDFIDILLNGDNIHDANNNNLAYFNIPALNKQMAAANKLVRRDALRGVRQPRREDHERTTRRGPPTTTATSASSSRRASGGYLFQPANASADLNTFFLKCRRRRFA